MCLPGIHREGRIPTKIETQRNPPVLAKLVELHNVFQGLHMCPIDLLVRNTLATDHLLILTFTALGERS